jgi:hypothetical protein
MVTYCRVADKNAKVLTSSCSPYNNSFEITLSLVKCSARYHV